MLILVYNPKYINWDQIEMVLGMMPDGTLSIKQTNDKIIPFYIVNSERPTLELTANVETGNI